MVCCQEAAYQRASRHASRQVLYLPSRRAGYRVPRRRCRRVAESRRQKEQTSRRSPTTVASPKPYSICLRIFSMLQYYLQISLLTRCSYTDSSARTERGRGGDEGSLRSNHHDAELTGGNGIFDLVHVDTPFKTSCASGDACARASSAGRGAGGIEVRCWPRGQCARRVQMPDRAAAAGHSRAAPIAGRGLATRSWPRRQWQALARGGAAGGVGGHIHHADDRRSRTRIHAHAILRTSVRSATGLSA